MSEESIIYIGNKPAMNYVLAVLTAYNTNGGEGVVLKARGQAISSAVDVAEICRNKFLSGVSKPIIEIGTEELPGDTGGTRNVSVISITLQPDKKTSKKKT
ncbi:DNA-binding protein Alba [Candidatus Bathyarchaeota archaeon]|nr:DNA-binding protein Alba [Candidatus Bathyarchaeota archaeon]